MAMARQQLDIKEIRRLIKSSVVAPSKLSPAQVLLRAASLRVITEAEFEAFQLQPR